MNQLTAQQILWARQHDWFLHKQGDMIVVLDRYTQHGKCHEEEIVWDKSFKELRDWAGY
jgi:hypothetical protein